MSARTDRLLASILPDRTHPLAVHLRVWALSRPFLAFAEAHAPKLRKKLREAAMEGPQADLHAELAVAAWLLRAAGVTLTYEPLKSAGGRGPDYALTLPDQTTVYIEATRLRPGGTQAPEYKLARVLADKIGQMRPGALNVLAVAVPSGTDTGTLAPAALRLLARAAQGDAFPAVSTERARDFERLRPRLGGVLCLEMGEPPAVTLWSHPGAAHPLPAAVRRVLG